MKVTEITLNNAMSVKVGMGISLTLVAWKNSKGTVSEK